MPASADLSPGTSLRVDPTLLTRSCGDGVLVASGSSRALDTIAPVVLLDDHSAEILNLFESPTTIAAVTAHVAGGFSATQGHEIANDVRALVVSLVGNGLLVEATRSR